MANPCSKAARNRQDATTGEIKAKIVPNSASPIPARFLPGQSRKSGRFGKNQGPKNGAKSARRCLHHQQSAALLSSAAANFSTPCRPTSPPRLQSQPTVAALQHRISKNDGFYKRFLVEAVPWLDWHRTRRHEQEPRSTSIAWD